MTLGETSEAEQALDRAGLSSQKVLYLRGTPEPGGSLLLTDGPGRMGRTEF